jgi:beta-lactamase class D
MSAGIPVGIARRGRMLLVVVAVACASGQDPRPEMGAALGREVDLSHIFAGGEPVDASFVLLEPASGTVTRHNAFKAAERFIPASTFKIPHTLIALETGVAPGADFTIAFDSLRDRTDGFWTTEWSRDQTLRSAFQNSVYWFYRETARRIGEKRMRAYLRLFDYGNQDMRGGVDRFWLEGALRISPDEQVEFLRRFHEETLGVSARSTEILKDIMILEEHPRYVLSGKTGTAAAAPDRDLAWLVGYVEQEGAVWYYALNVEGADVWERWGRPTARRQLVVTILRELGVIQPELP